MSDLLHDRIRHHLLSKAVREHCPQDWRASSRHRRARLWSASGRMDKVVAFLGFIILGDVLAIPFILFEESRLLSHEAAGLTGLHLLCASMVLGMGLMAAPSVNIAPLLNMPVSMAELHRHLLRCLRWHCLRLMAVGLLIFVSAFALMVFLERTENLSVAMSRIPAAVLLSFGPGVALHWLSRSLMGAMTHLPQSLRRSLALMPATIFCLFLWELAYFFFHGLPSPGMVGAALAALPQVELCEWVLGAEFPWRAVLLCLSATLVSGWRLLELLRDPHPELDEDYLHHSPELTAEALLAAALNQKRLQLGWPQLSLHGSEYYHHHLNEDDDEFFSDSEENRAPSELGDELIEEDRLFEHASAPKEHNVPVSAEFRGVMAAELQRLLDAAPGDCLMQLTLSLPTPEPPLLSMIFKRALLLGTVPLLLIELKSHVPASWPEWPEMILFFAALILSGWLMMWATLRHPLPEKLWPYHSWPRLPFDGSTWLHQYAIFESSWFRWRCRFVLVALASWTVSFLFIVSVKQFLGIEEGFSQWEGLYHGVVSILSVGLLLFLLMWGVRCVESFSFIRRVAAAVKWRWLWKSWLTGILVLHILEAAAIFMGWIWSFLMIADDWNGWLGWLTPPLLLIAATLRCFGRWLASQALRHGRGDV